MSAPPAGVPPTLEWVAVERLTLDHSYQRYADDARSKKLIRYIAEGFDWSLCQPLSCCRRDDGSIVVVDGQHRLLGARARDDIPHLPCVISSAVGQEGEAAMFAALNRQRKSLSRHEIWRAAIAAGDEDAVQAAALIEGVGLTLAPHTNYESWKPGHFGGMAAVVRGMKQHGTMPVEMALIGLAEAYAGEVLQYGVTLIHALIPMYADLLRKPDLFDPDLLISVLGSKGQDEWRDNALMAARSQLRDAKQVLREDIERAYRAAHRKAA